MSKHVSKFLCALLALVLIFSTVACMAETIRRTYYDYEKKNSKRHYVYYETWEYSIVDGVEVSGHPVDSGEYTEKHTFDDGECIYCGYKKSTKKTENTTETTETSDEPNAFTLASGITVTKGAAADVTLKQVFAAIPANTEVSFEGVDQAVADELVKAINEGATSAELLAILAKFPTQTVDGILCNVVTLSYTDAAGKAVVENYAFSTADGTLVKVF
jgi:hypothetical protein